VSIHIFIDVDEWLDALDAHEGPGIETTFALGAVLAAGFAETQELVHVVTGSLQASGRMGTKTNDDSWEGEITYGGSAPGFPHNPVTYAKKEFGKGEEHDAMRNLDLMDQDYLEAMTATVKARLG